MSLLRFVRPAIFITVSDDLPRSDKDAIGNDGEASDQEDEDKMNIDN